MKDETRRRADELISEIYAALLGTAPWQNLLDSRSRSLPNGKTTLSYYDVAVGRGEFTLNSQFDARSLAAYRSYYSARNPYIPKVVGRPLGLGVRAEQMLAREELLRTEFYVDFLRPQGLETGVGVTVFREHGRHFMLGTACAHADDTRMQSAASLLGLLAPHLRQAFTYYRCAGSLAAKPIAVDSALEALGVAVVSVGIDKRVRWCNAVGQELLSSGDPIGINACGRLTTLHGEIQQAMDLAVCAAARGELIDKQTVSLPAHAGERLLTRITVVVPALRSCQKYFAGPCVLLLFELTSPSELPAEDVLRRIFALTPSEARFARAMATGATLADAAAAQSITKETARTHLKRIFAKMDVRRQAELVAKIHHAVDQKPDLRSG
jgi:DNA-binding CsgD family transcriptional regulator